MIYSNHRLERTWRVSIIMAGICLSGSMPGADAQTELNPLLQNMQEVESGIEPQPQPEPPLLEPETTLIGGSRLPNMVVNEFDVTSGGTLGSVLRSLAKLADVNLVFSDVVNDQESLSFTMQKPTPWNDLFDSILKVHHLTHLQDPNMIRILTVEDMELEYELQETISRRIALDAETRRTEEMVLAVIDIKYAKAEALVVVLKELLENSAAQSGGGEAQGAVRGSVGADTANNSVIINAIQSDVDKLVNLVKKMDQPSRQVRIEANIVEVSNSLVKELGLKWAAEAKFKDYGETDPVVERSVPETYGVLDDTFGKMGGVMDPLTGMVQYGILTKDFNLAATLTALEEDGKVKILSQPSITTMDNMKAIIKSGKDVPFSTLNRDGDPVVQWQEAVLLLEVTPHLIDEDELTLDIEILNDEVDFSETVDGNPVIQKKQARSFLVLRDGETTVIAGLSKNNLEQTDSGIPLLKDIPFLGMLFKYKRDSDRTQEMVIFITPRVVDERQRDESAYVSNWIDSTYNK
jgi:type IV pilus assembly protein PilQ